MNRHFLRIDPARRTALRRLCAGLLLVFYAFFSGAKAHSQTHRVPGCTPDMLDVSMLLPSDDAPSAPAGLFAVAFRNRSALTCTLPGIIPLWDGNNESQARGGDDSDEARLFKSANNRLAPGEQAHLTFGWSAVPSVYRNFAFGGCSSYDDLTLVLELRQDVKLLRTRHLWVRSCGGIWASHLRGGPFLATENVPAEWLDSYKINLSDVARPILPLEGTPSDDILNPLFAYPPFQTSGGASFHRQK